MLRSFAAVAFLTSAMVSSPATASSQTGGKVILLAADNFGGPNAFQVGGGTRTTKPACATDDLWTISNPSTDNAKSLYATIMTAYALGRLVTIVGSGVCDAAAPTRETVSYINTLQ